MSEQDAETVRQHKKTVVWLVWSSGLSGLSGFFIE
jgi:hypothetical protein